jgi:hypothetical protein
VPLLFPVFSPLSSNTTSAGVGLPWVWAPQVACIVYSERRGWRVFEGGWGVRASRRCWRQGPPPSVEPLDGGRTRSRSPPPSRCRALPLAPARALRPSPAALRRLEAARAARSRQGGAEVASYLGGERSARARSPAGWCGGRLASLGPAFPLRSAPGPFPRNRLPLSRLNGAR